MLRRLREFDHGGCESPDLERVRQTVLQHAAAAEAFEDRHAVVPHVPVVGLAAGAAEVATHLQDLGVNRGPAGRPLGDRVGEFAFEFEILAHFQFVPDRTEEVVQDVAPRLP